MTIRIDFHLHTTSMAEKDDGFTFSLPWLKKYTEKFKLDAIAITNHNSFDLEQFNEIENELSCTVLPGIELSLAEGHANLVFNNTKEIKQELAHISSQLNLGKSNGLDLTKFKELFSNLKECLFIYEDGKSNSLIFNDRFNDAFFKNYTFVRGVNSQLKFHRALLKEAPCPALFSDGHATEEDPDPVRNDINKLALKNTFLQMENFSFDQLLLEFRNSNHVTVTKDGNPSIIEIDVDGKPITVSTKLNLIVGRRGSGKTFLLDHINQQYQEEGAHVSYIKQFRSSEDTKKFLQIESMTKASDELHHWYEKHQKMLNSIVAFYKDQTVDQTDDYFDEYIQNVKRFSNEIAKAKIAKQVKLFSQTTFETFDFTSITDSIKNLREVINDQRLWQFATPDLLSKHKRSLKEAYSDLRSNLIKQEIKKHIQENVNNIIGTVKTIVTNTTAIEPIQQDKLIYQFKQKKEKSIIEKCVRLALEEDSDTVTPEYSYKMHVWKSNWKDSDDFLKSIPYKGSKIAVKEKLINPYLKKDYHLFLTNLFSTRYQESFIIENGSELSKYLFQFKVELLTLADTPASGGQQMALGLMMKLDDSRKADIILVDEPEGSLDNVFIKNELIPKLRELAKTTPVFVITHNSTLGALLNPERLIISKFDTTKKHYEILTGDFLSKVVTDCYGNKNYSYEDFIDAMEAGLDTYKKKGKQYGNLNPEKQ